VRREPAVVTRGDHHTAATPTRIEISVSDTAGSVTAPTRITVLRDATDGHTWPPMPPRKPKGKPAPPIPPWVARKKGGWR
jgi:hypothetical protein